MKSVRVMPIRRIPQMIGIALPLPSSDEHIRRRVEGWRPVAGGGYKKVNRQNSA